MAFCTNCGSNLTDDTKFCPNCGTKIQEAAVEETYTAPVQPAFTQAPAVEAPAQSEGGYNAGSYDAQSYNAGSYDAGSYGAPVQTYGAPVQAEPQEAPAVEAPVQSEGGYNAGGYDAQSYNAGGYNAGSYGAPAQPYGAPVQAEPQEAPDVEAPAQSEGGYNAGGYDAQSYNAGGYNAGSYGAPAQTYGAPVQAEPQEAPAVEAPVQSEGGYNAGGYDAQSYNAGGYNAGSYGAPAQSYGVPNQQGYGAAPVYAPGNAAAAKSSRANPKLFIIIGGVVLVALAVLALLIFGGKKDGSKSTDPNAGVYNAISAEAMGIEMPIEDLFENGFSIELKDKGKCVINADGTKKNGKWELDGSDITIKGGGVTLEGTLENGIISINDLMNMGVSVKFANTDVQMLDGDGMAMPVPDGQTAASGDVQEKWNGLWYGCMYIGEAEGDFSAITSSSHDVFMTVDVDAEGKGSLQVYMNDTETLFATADCYIGDYGLVTTSGMIADVHEMNTDNWKLVPVPNYTDLYVMMDRIEDGESELEYYLYVKQWGKSWEEEIESRSTMIPPSVEQYNNAIASGDDAPFGEGWGASGASMEGFVSPTTSVDMDSIWYGTIRYSNFKGRDTEDYTDDVFAWIKTEKDTGKPFFELFTTSDFTQESMLLSMYVELTGDGFDADIGDDDAWIIREWLSKDDEQYFSPRLENGALVMDYTYLDSQDDYSCDITIFLRVDGTPWDAENDLLPPHYEDYAAALAAKEGDKPADEPAQEAAASGDYGKSNAQADGITDFDTLKACYKWYKGISGYENNYYSPTYEEVYEQLGVHGRKDHEDSWRDDYHVYKWETADGKDFLLFSFKVDDQGNERFNSVSWSSPLAK